MDVLAHAAAVVIEPEVIETARRDAIQGRLARLLRDGGPHVVLQPIVDLASGQRVGAEALSRFPAEWGKAPDLCFADAHSVGQGDDLEVIALRGAADHLPHVDGYVAMNVSPSTLLTPQCRDLLAGLPLGRVVLELSEHSQVEDYPALLATLDPLRAADVIAREELTRAGLDRDIWQCPVVLLADVRSVGVQGDGRTYGHPIVLRPVASEDAMTADWARVPYDVLAHISTRITNEVPEVNRVVLDVTSKPPGTIEWE
jgi:hypothetical protein